MLIAIFSDSHDHMDRLKQALEMVRERTITNGFHLGDFCSPQVLELLATSGIHWQAVWGNNDGDKLLGYRTVMNHGTIDLVTEDFREIELEGKKLFLTHYPKIARLAALSGEYDAAFYGHNHLAAQEMIESASEPKRQVLLANPGEIMGFRYGKPSFGIYNTDSNGFEIVRITKDE